jgi:hypothetical protein
MKLNQGHVMKILLSLILFAAISVSNTGILFSEETDPGIMPVVNAAKEFIARNHNCKEEDLTIGDTLIGRRAAHVDVNCGYTAYRVSLRFVESENAWEAESSMPLHEY